MVQSCIINATNSYFLRKNKFEQIVNRYFTFWSQRYCVLSKSKGKELTLEMIRDWESPVCSNSLVRRRILNFWRNCSKSLKSVNRHEYWNLIFWGKCFNRRKSMFSLDNLPIIKFRITEGDLAYNWPQGD